MAEAVGAEVDSLKEQLVAAERRKGQADIVVVRLSHRLSLIHSIGLSSQFVHWMASTDLRKTRCCCALYIL